MSVSKISNKNIYKINSNNVVLDNVINKTNIQEYQVNKELEEDTMIYSYTFNNIYPNEYELAGNGVDIFTAESIARVEAYYYKNKINIPKFSNYNLNKVIAIIEKDDEEKEKTQTSQLANIQRYRSSDTSIDWTAIKDLSVPFSTSQYNPSSKIEETKTKEPKAIADRYITLQTSATLNDNSYFNFQEFEDYYECDFYALCGNAEITAYEQKAFGILKQELYFDKIMPKSLTLFFYGSVMKSSFVQSEENIVQDADYVHPGNNLINKNTMFFEENITDSISKSIINKYQDGNKLINLTCSISDFYDYENNKNIDIKGEKKIFENGDLCIPYKNVNGVETPIYTNLQNEPVVFEVVSNDIVFDGAIFQQMQLKETFYKEHKHFLYNILLDHVYINEYVDNQENLETITIPNASDFNCNSIIVGENCFKNIEPSVKNIIVSKDVTKLENEAFNDIDIESVSFNSVSKLKNIGDRCFKSCGSLKSLILPDSVIKLGNQVFIYSALENLNIGNSLQFIESESFADLTSLKNISINSENIYFKDVYNIMYNKLGNKLILCPAKKEGEVLSISETVNEISPYAFQGSLINQITVPSSVTKIGNNNFYLSYTTSVILPNSIKTIEEYCFFGCDLMQSVNIPNSITLIKEQSFSRNEILSTVIIGDNVKGLGLYCFSRNPNLENISIGNNIESMGANCFASIPYIQNYQSGEDGVVYLFSRDNTVAYAIGVNKKFQGDVVLNNKTKTLVDYLFNGNKTLTSIVIPENVLYLGVFSFYECSNLKEISIKNGLKQIGANCFAKCSELFNITLPESLENIEPSILKDCDNINYITIPFLGSRKNQDSNSKGAYDLGFLFGVSNYKVPDSLKHIKITQDEIIIKSAFEDCYEIESIEYLNEMQSIEQFAFDNCYNLTSLTFHSVNPPTLSADISENINIYVPINSVNIYKTADEWNNYSSNIYSLVNRDYEYTISNNTANIRRYKTTSPENRNIKLELASEFGAENIVFVNGSGTNHMFYGIKDTLEQIELNNDLISIGRQSFYYCSKLKSINIPSSVTSIGTSAFEYCYGLTFVKIYATTPPTLGSEVFETTNNCPIYVPSESVNDYKTASGWSNYASRIFSL